MWFAHGSERSAGVTSLKNTFLEMFWRHFQFGHFLFLLISWNNLFFILVNIYGYNFNTENDNLFDSLDDRLSFWFQKYPQAFLLVGGDLNIFYKY